MTRFISKFYKKKFNNAGHNQFSLILRLIKKLTSNIFCIPFFMSHYDFSLHRFVEKQETKLNIMIWQNWLKRYKMKYMLISSKFIGVLWWGEMWIVFHSTLLNVKWHLNKSIHYSYHLPLLNGLYFCVWKFSGICQSLDSRLCKWLISLDFHKGIVFNGLS